MSHGSRVVDEDSGNLGPRGRTILIALAAGLLLSPLVFNLPPEGWFMATLQDAAHGPVFAAVAWITIRLLTRHGEPKRTRYRKYWAALAICIALGCAIEVIQYFTGRDASLGDVLTDTLGAVLGLSVAALLDRRMSHRRHRRVVAMLVALATAMALAYPVFDAGQAYVLRAHRMPALLVAERSDDLRFVKSEGAWILRSALPEPWSTQMDEPSLEVVFRKATYSGFELEEPYPDWRGFKSLVFDLTNPGTESAPITIRVHDAGHDLEYQDRFNHQYELAPQLRQQIRIPLEEIENAPRGRKLDLAHVAGIGVFTTQGDRLAGQKFFLTRIWLAGE